MNASPTVPGPACVPTVGLTSVRILSIGLSSCSARASNAFASSAALAWRVAIRPVQFEPELLRASVLRLLTFKPDCMYLTHYGRVGDVARLGASFLEQLEAMVQLGHSVRAHPDRHAALKRGLAELYATRLSAHGCSMDHDAALDLLAMDLELNAQGMGIWLDRSAP